MTSARGKVVPFWGIEWKKMRGIKFATGLGVKFPKSKILCLQCRFSFYTSFRVLYPVRSL